MKKLKEPFFIVPSKVFSLGLTPYELAIVFYLCMRADNEKHTCWPSVTSISKECGMSDAKVRRCIHDLQERQIIEIKKQYASTKKGINRQCSNFYTLLIFEENDAKSVQGTGGGTTLDSGSVYDISPPPVPHTGEINKTIFNKTKTNIIKSIELRPAESEIERKNKKVFEDLKDECLRALSLEWRVSEDYCEMVNKALIDIWNRGCFFHDGRTYSGDEVCTILCERLTATRVKRALDAMLERGDEVRLPLLYLAKCIFASLVSPISDEKKGKSPQNSSFDIDDFFETALRRSDEVLSKYDTANVGKG